MRIGQPEVAPLENEDKSGVVDPHQMQDCGVEVVNLDRFLDDEEVRSGRGSNGG
jgi:hypothetical protein